MADEGITIQLQGHRDCVEAFKELRDYVRGDSFRNAVRAAAKLMLDEIYARAPVLTGKLVSNLRVAIRKTATTVRARVIINQVGKGDDKNNAFYWRFVEFGTKHAAPHPFITPAFEARREAAAQHVIDEFEIGLDKAERRARRMSTS